MTAGPADDDSALERRLHRWLRDEAGIDGPRRLVRVGDDRILVTKVPEGFAAELLTGVYALPALAALAPLRRAYAASAARLPGVSSVRTWRASVESLIDEALTAELVSLREDILIGIESVEAMLDTIFWGGPTNEQGHTPLPGEREAYRDATARLESAQDLFTRRYGVFEGREVVNYCPAAPLARTILSNGWAVITGSR